jgi:hypothetical protein
MSDALAKWREENEGKDIELKAAQPNPILRYREKPTAHKAIKAKCSQCVGCTDEHLEQGFRNDIKRCTDQSCALHPYRPYQDKSKDDELEDGE